MMNPTARRLLLVCFALWYCVSARAADPPPPTGPATERRFPPLKVPPGFKATLYACDPLIEYPSVISAGPRPGAIFVAVDYLTGLGTEITRRSEVRLVEDTDGDGYADKATVFAGGLNSIMGLAWHGDTLYVMHAPLLSALRDTRGAGVADERRDLVSGLGLPPEENPVRLHCANGVTVRHDGWLYLALGDHGCNVRRPEGDRLILEGGGILRCRPDGRDLHVFATGLRNIYDVALDAELNVFVRDNENDGGAYKNRVCHSFFGADHGYPYLYYERPTEALPPLADLGLGSSAGGVCYLERHFPPEYRSLYFCEWGKSLVRYPLTRAGSSFASPPEIEFAVGAEGDPYGFKPTDVVVQRDGTMMVSDYADGQRPQRGRGRVYHIAFAGAATVQAPPLPDDPLARLDSESYYKRCEAQTVIEGEAESGLNRLTAALSAGRLGPRGRLHAIWILVRLQGDKAIESLLAIASSDPEPSVRAQAVRAIADLADPLLAQHRLDAGPGDPKLAAHLAALDDGQDRRVGLEIIIALGRLRWAGTADWLKNNLTKPDAALAHAAQQSLRRTGNWPAILKLLDTPADEPLRGIALRATARQYDAVLVDGLLDRLAREQDVARSLEYAETLAHVVKKPGPWVYWDYRPKPRPPNQVSWERTETIATALNEVLSRGNAELRLAVLKQMQREQIPANLKAVGEWLQQENAPERVAALLDFLRDQPADLQQYLIPVIRSPSQSLANRRSALALYVQGIDQEHADSLLALSKELEDGPILADALRSMAKYPKLMATSLLVVKLNSARPEVRAAAIETLGDLQAVEKGDHVERLLADPDPQVRRAAASAAGKLLVRSAVASLRQLAAGDEAPVRIASLDALRLLKDPHAVPLALTALGDRQTEQIALEILRALGGPDNSDAVTDLATRNPSLEALTSTVQTLFTWRERPTTTETQRQELDRAVAEIKGTSGNLISWKVSGPGLLDPAIDQEYADARIQFATGTEGRLVLSAQGVAPGQGSQAYTEVAVAEPTEVEFLGSSSGRLQVWLNGQSIYERGTAQNLRIDSDRMSATLAKGTNRLTVRVTSTSPESPLEFHLRFRRKSTQVEHEKLLQAALSRPGNLEQGRALFFNTEKSLCLKCHRLGDQGERTGPELTGLGSRFSRIYIAESILQPSRTIASSFGTVVVVLNSGKTVSGVKIAESLVERENQLTLVDNQGQKHVIAKDEIEAQTTSLVSTMPEGLEKRLTEEEFVDLTAFLASLKEVPKP